MNEPLTTTAVDVSSTNLIGGKCRVCQESYTSDDDLFVHVYICHPELNDSICKMLDGEPYETAEQLRARGILPPIACVSDGPANAPELTRSAEGPFAARNG